ncbi:MAG: radical SAM protein [Epulopiscium sp.]|nr:radical SAM protein [Candidatus Epulonipiscium sp.]
MKRFKKIYVEITNACNLSCTFCPKSNRKPQFMSIENFRKILNQISPYTEYIYFHVKGEPLLHPDIDKFLDISYEKGFRVNITTNGTLIDKVRDKIIMKKSLRQINFSLHSLSGNQGYTSEKSYMKDIISFTKESMEKTNLLISLRFWNLNYDAGINGSMESNRGLLEIIEKEFKLPYKIDEKVMPGRGIKIAERVYINQDYEFAWPNLKEKEDDGRGFCYGLRKQAAILVDGTVVPCCLDGEGIINLGNIHNVDFSRIIESKRAKEIYEGFSKRYAIEELCRKCGYKKKFNNNNE